MTRAIANGSPSLIASLRQQQGSICQSDTVSPQRLRRDSRLPKPCARQCFLGCPLSPGHVMAGPRPVAVAARKYGLPSPITTAPQAARSALEGVLTVHVKRVLRVNFDPLLDWMRSANVPIMRDTYIALSWGANVPDPWMPEDEAELPSFLRSGRSAAQAAPAVIFTLTWNVRRSNVPRECGRAATGGASAGPSDLRAFCNDSGLHVETVPASLEPAVRPNHIAGDASGFNGGLPCSGAKLSASTCANI